LLFVGEGPPQGPLLAALEGPPSRLAVVDVQQTPGRVLHLELWQAELAPRQVETLSQSLIAHAGRHVTAGRHPN
jgi:hypothetical protein